MGLDLLGEATSLGNQACYMHLCDDGYSEIEKPPIVEILVNQNASMSGRLYEHCNGADRAEEYVNGQLKNKYGDAFIRGNNVLYISTSQRGLLQMGLSIDEAGSG